MDEYRQICTYHMMVSSEFSAFSFGYVSYLFSKRVPSSHGFANSRDGWKIRFHSEFLSARLLKKI